jgi:hypothetical protein
MGDGGTDAGLTGDATGGVRRKRDPMNKRLGLGGLRDEATARAVNTQPWDPMPGMEKRQCPRCRYWFAADPASAESRCQDCAMPRREAAR